MHISRKMFFFSYRFHLNDVDVECKNYLQEYIDLGLRLIAFSSAEHVNVTY